MSTTIKLDSGMLQYAPKGAFYEDKDEQFKKVLELWTYLFNFDRSLFCLTSLLPGTGFSKGAMAHILLGNNSNINNLPAPQGLPFDYESKVILYNLYKESVPRALKNLLMLTGTEGFRKVNNARARKIILQYIFDRPTDELDSLAVNFKGKLRTLIRHALGKQDTYKILNGDLKLFNKWIGRYRESAYPVFMHIFDKEPGYKTPDPVVFYKQISEYWKIKNAAKAGDVNNFRKYMKHMPQRTVIGFRNTYKLPIELSEIYDNTKVSTKESIQMESAAKRSGAKTFKVDYMKQELYDLWKVLYHKVLTNDTDNIDSIVNAIMVKADKQKKINIGECAIILDLSKSMEGSESRPLHPFLTSLCLVSSLDNVKNVFPIGGKYIDIPNSITVGIPANSTPLWKGLIEAAKTGIKNIVVISDGYENEVKGMFQHTYKYLKNKYNFNLIHINPVFAADASSGTVRRIVDDVDPMPIADHKFLETEIIFKQMIGNRDMVKQLLIGKFNQLIK